MKETAAMLAMIAASYLLVLWAIVTTVWVIRAVFG